MRERRSATGCWAIFVLGLLVVPALSSASRGNDCNDGDSSVNPAQGEVIGNVRDDDCDGLADEDLAGNPSTNMSDSDGDTQSLAIGDCDDTQPSTALGATEIVGNRRDDNCNRLTDEGPDGTPTLDRQDLDGDGFDIGPQLFGDAFE